MEINNTHSSSDVLGKSRPDFLNGSTKHDFNKNDYNSDLAEIYVGKTILLASTLMTITFNGSLLFCILKNKKKQWTRNAHQIKYLIMSDFLVGLFLLPRNAQIFMRETGIPFGTCATFSYILNATQNVSFYHIMTVCIHRVRKAIRIHVPFDTDRYNYRQESLVIWVGVLLTMIPPYAIWGRHGELLYKCRFEFVFGPLDAGAQVYILVLYIIPWITTNACYVFVLFKVKNSLKRIHVINSDLNEPTQTDTSVSQTDQTNKKILKTVGLLLLTFNISIMVNIAVVIGVLYEVVVPHVLQSFFLVNNICNPFIYMSASSSLKKETQRVIYEIVSIFKCTCSP